jgi:hypothetical protein
MGGILAFAPLDLVYLFLDFKRFKVVKFGFVGLKFGMEFVFTCLFLSTTLAAQPFFEWD